MITFRKRILTASTPVVLGGILMAGALGVAEIMTGGAEASMADTVPAQTAAAPAAGKGDLKVDLAEVQDRHMRCVAGFNKTTCTGWPVGPEIVAYRAE